MKRGKNQFSFVNSNNKGGLGQVTVERRWGREYLINIPNTFVKLLNFRNVFSVLYAFYNTPEEIRFTLLAAIQQC